MCFCKYSAVFVILFISAAFATTTTKTAKNAMMTREVGKTTISVVGDFNGDGVDDFAVQGEGSVSVGYGHSLLPQLELVYAKVWLAPLPEGFVDEEDFNSEHLNFGLGLAYGNINGDTYDDLVIGDPDYNRIFVRYGSLTPWGLETDSVDSLTFDIADHVTFEIDGPQNSDSFGSRVKVADLDANHIGDLIVADPGYADGAGRLCFYMNGSRSLSFELIGTAPDDLMGVYLIHDDLIGDAGYDFATNVGASIYILDSSFFQSDPPKSSQITPSVTYAVPNERDIYFATSGQILGDLTTSKSELVVGVLEDDAIFIISGSTSTTGAFPSHLIRLNHSDVEKSFGSMIAVHDVDLDLIDDVSVYRSSISGITPKAGAVTVIRGSSLRSLSEAAGGSQIEIDFNSVEPFFAGLGLEEGEDFGKYH
ncbi:MAG: hypothetical protein HQL31_06375, partial [Planctomycetes bacterium]|nr:hypothetical protein [Planctomycetota bacterium]